MSARRQIQEAIVNAVTDRGRVPNTIRMRPDFALDLELEIGNVHDGLRFLNVGDTIWGMTVGPFLPPDSPSDFILVDHPTSKHMTPLEFSEWIKGKVIDHVTFHQYENGHCISSFTTTDGYCVTFGPSWKETTVVDYIGGQFIVT